MLIKGVNIGSIKTIGETPGVKDQFDLKHASLAFRKWWEVMRKIPGDLSASEVAFGRTIACNKIREDRIQHLEMPEFCKALVGTFVALLTENYPNESLDPGLAECAEFAAKRPKQAIAECGCPYDEEQAKLLWRRFSQDAAFHFWIVGSLSVLPMPWGWLRERLVKEILYALRLAALLLSFYARSLTITSLLEKHIATDICMVKRWRCFTAARPGFRNLSCIDGLFGVSVKWVRRYLFGCI